MEFSIEESPEIKNETIISYIWKLIQKYREKKEQNSIECILCEQKLIHLSIMLLQKQPKMNIEFNMKDQCVGFIQKINKLAMENMKDQSENSGVKLFIKAVDVVMLPQLSKYITEQNNLGKLKVLTFNNLACLYKKSKHYMMALRAVSFALDLQQYLIKDVKDEEKYDIIPTYLNKAAILSEMKKHDQALEQIRKAKIYIEKIEKDVEKKIHEASDLNVYKRLQQKRHYGLYMKMLINYNIGVQKQHQKLITSAIFFYQESKKLAVTINNQFMAKKLQDIILKLK